MKFKNWIAKNFLSGTYKLHKSDYDVIRVRGGFAVVNRPEEGISIIVREFIDSDKDYAYNEAEQLIYYLTRDI